LLAEADILQVTERKPPLVRDRSLLGQRHANAATAPNTEIATMMSAATTCRSSFSVAKALTVETAR